MKSKTVSNNHIVIALVALILLTLVAGLLVYKAKTNLLVSHEFDGTIMQIKDNILTVQGSFIDTSSKSIINAYNDNKPVTIGIEINAGTKITRTAITLPSAQELKATNGMYNADKLKTQESNSDLETLRKDISQGPVGIFAKPVKDKNIFGQGSFVAQEITYRVAVRK